MNVYLRWTAVLPDLDKGPDTKCSNIRPARFCFFKAEDGIRDDLETGVQTCALPITSYAVFCLKKTLPPQPASAKPRAARPRTSRAWPSSASTTARGATVARVLATRSHAYVDTATRY